MLGVLSALGQQLASIGEPVAHNLQPGNGALRQLDFAALDHVPGVARLLTFDDIRQQDRQAARQGLGDDQPARFANDAIGSLHQRRHVLHKVVHVSWDMPLCALELLI